MTQQQPKAHNYCHQSQGGANQHLRQAIEPLLQGGALAASGVDQGGYLPQLRGHAGRSHHRHPAAPNHLGALEQAVLALQHRRGRLQHQIGPLKHSLRLTGEGGFSHAHIGRFQQAPISRHPIAGLEADQVARHKLLTRQPLPLAVAPHLHLGLGQIAQSKQRLLGPALLEIAQQAIQTNNQHDGDRILRKLLLHIGHAGRNCCNRQQHDQHHVAELVPEDLPVAAASS